MRKKYQQFHSATMKAFKIAFVMLFLLSNCAIVMAQSPNKKISVTCKNEPLASALKKVEKASGYKVLFTYDEVQNYKVTISAKGQEVSHVLKTIFDKLPFDYKFKGKYINVSKRERRILNISDGPEKGDHIVRRALKNLSKSKPNNKNSGAATPLCCDPAFIRNFQKYLKNSPNNASQTYI